MSISEQNRLGDHLKYKADKNYCREVGTVAAGQKMQLGTIVGRKNEIGEIKEVSVKKSPMEAILQLEFCLKTSMLLEKVAKV